MAARLLLAQVLLLSTLISFVSPIVLAADILAEEASTVLEYFETIDLSTLNTDQASFVQQCRLGDPKSVHRAAGVLISKDSPLGPKDAKLGFDLYAYAANAKDYASSQAKLGELYASGSPPLATKSPARALKYFTKAGQQGHHSSLYNAGLILAEGLSPTDEMLLQAGAVSMDDYVKEDILGALAYFQAAATLHETFPEDAEEKITDVARTAHGITCRKASQRELTTRESADAFMFGTLAPSVLEGELERLWREAIGSLTKFNDTFVRTEGSVQDESSMKSAAAALSRIANDYGATLSELQTYLVLDNLNDMLGPLAGLDEKYVADAARRAEELASSTLCMEQYAVTEGDPACFNGAAASAVSFYRRARDEAGAERVLKLANAHEDASTSWDRAIQTPRVYHPNLTSKPWWNPDDFSAAKALRDAYADPTLKTSMLEELQAVIALQEGKLRGANEVEIDPGGFTTEPESKTTAGMQRIFTPYIGVRTSDAKASSEGAGGWAEFGPLYDGATWNTERCNIVPTICNALREDKSLCTARQKTQNENVWELCGSDTVVTILRLRPRTSILPHCGTTNSRLIMHFPFVGAEKVRFVVGDETVMSYGGGDGSPIVFDDSFEHHVYHEGANDRFVVLAVLAHPDLV